MLCYCKKCGRIIGVDKNDTYTCDYCLNTVVPVPIDFLVSENVPVINQKLKEQFINEYIKSSPEFDQYLFEHRDQDLFNRRMSDQAKLSHGKTMLEEASKTPKCPTCQSTNIRKMGGIERGASIATFGLFSKKINKTFKCNHCGYTW